MFRKEFFKQFIPFFLTLLGIEFGSRIVAYQPISTSWRELQSNGLATNISNSSGLHEFWEIGIKEYSFGDYANRISLNSQPNSTQVYRQSCSYLILGDSYTFGWLVEFEEAFPSLIEKYLNKNLSQNRMIKFINSAAGGWGLADYPAYIEIFKKKLQQLNLNGIVVFVNIDDGRRAAISNLYSISKFQDIPFAKKDNKNFISKKGLIKRTLNHPLISPIYNFSQKNSNFARILKRLFLDNTIDIYPRKNIVENRQRFLTFGEKFETNLNITKEAKLKIDRSMIDLQKQSSQLAPLLMVYTGVAPIENMDPNNRYMFSSEFKKNAQSQGTKIDFSTLPKKELYPSSHIFKYDGHPNIEGHKSIANHIINSSSANSLRNFIETTCSN